MTLKKLWEDKGQLIIVGMLIVVIFALVIFNQTRGTDGLYKKITEDQLDTITKLKTNNDALFQTVKEQQQIINSFKK